MEYHPAINYHGIKQFNGGKIMSKCKECGYRIRSKYHKDGKHHKELHPKLREEIKKEREVK